MSMLRLYDSDPYLQEITARVLSREDDTAGHRITLDSTILYPGGGGQQPDRGWINNEPVCNIRSEAGVTWYYLDNPVPDEVTLKLDWKYRYDNMQQHTGQHVLSAVLEKILQMQTVSVHLGQEDTLIELQVMSIADDQIKLAEQEANRIIRANYPVRAIMCKKNELHKYQLRRDIKVDSDPVRIVNIGEYDLTGCGGTHVATTAEIGLIKIISTEKIRGRIRIAARIGAAAYEYLDLLNVQARQLGKEMSCAAHELADRYHLIAEELKQTKREVKKIRARWLKEYILRLEPKNRIGYFMLTDLEADDLGQLVQFWVENYQLPCLIISHSNGKSYFNLQVPDQWPSDAGEFVRVNSNTLSFQGGGNPGHASGILTGGFPSDDFLQMVETKLRQFFKCGEIRE